MPRVVHFEISVDEPERALAFYKEVFGWEVHKWDGPQPYWLIKTGPDGQPRINGGMFVRQGPMTGHVNTIDVPSVDDYMAKIEANGGTIVVPKTAIPGIGWLVYAKDTEGSIFGITQSDLGEMRACETIDSKSHIPESKWIFSLTR